MEVPSLWGRVRSPPARQPPRWRSRSAKRRRAVESRLYTVPAGIPSRLAAVACGSPSRSHATTSDRYRSGRPASSSATAAQTSKVGSGSHRPVSGSVAMSDSRAVRRPVRFRASPAAFTATPNSQPATAPAGFSVPALRASTWKVAWKASSASCTCRVIRRQTASTIGPCLWTSWANASWSPAEVNRSTSSPSGSAS